MRAALFALAHGLRAPLARWKLVLALWLVRLLPIIAVLGLPLYHRVVEHVGRHPDAGQVIAPESDPSGFAFAWTSDFFRDVSADVPDRLFWLVVAAWFLVMLLAGGIVARLLHAADDPDAVAESGRSGFFADCGRYFGRFFRLAVLVVVVAHGIDYGLNGILAESQARRAEVHHTQDFAIQRTLARGLLDLALLWLLGVVAAYAQIEIVAGQRRSAVRAFARAALTVIGRFPRVLVVELGLLLATGLAIGAAWLLPGALAPDSASTGLGIGLFVLVAAAVSYLRSGLEVGGMEARVRLAGAGERLDSGRFEAADPAVGSWPDTGEIPEI